MEQRWKQIAFASDRYGNFDVFTLPVTEELLPD
jgi:hypothetical protein